MAAPMAVSASTWNSLKSTNIDAFPDLFSSILVERQALSCQGSGFAISVVSHINSSLSTSATRLEGLFLLQHFIDQCGTDTLNDAALSWIGQLTNILQSYETTVVHRVSCKILATLLAEIRPLTELSHEAATSHVPQVVLALLAAKEQWHLSAVQCLTSCMENFQGPCGPFKDKIEKFILPMILEDVDPDTWKIAARCFALLPACGGGGHQSIKHTEAWEIHFNTLLGSLQVTVSDLYQGLEDEDDVPKPRHTLRGLEPIDEMDANRCHKLTNRFLAVATCLAEMLRREYGFSLKIPARDVLNFICRCLAVNSKFLESRPSTERLVLSTVVGLIHQGALNILEALIHSCRTILLPQSNIVSKLLLQTLSWSQTDDNPARHKAYSSLRRTVYAVLVMWLKACGNLPSLESLVQCILVDVKPGTEILRLDPKQSKLSDAQELMGKKKKRKQKSQPLTIGAVSKLTQKGDTELCSEALKALRQVLLSTGHSLRTRTLQNVEEFIIPLLLKLQSGNELPPYTGGLCRMELYRTLQAMVLVSHPTWQPSTHCVIRLFSAGQRDTNIEISSYAMESLALCTALIHPKVPALYSAPPIIRKEKDVSLAVTATDLRSCSEDHDSIFVENVREMVLQGVGDAKTVKVTEDDLITTDAGVAADAGREKLEERGRGTGAMANGETRMEMESDDKTDEDGADEAEGVDGEDEDAEAAEVVVTPETEMEMSASDDKQIKDSGEMDAGRVQTSSKKRKIESDLDSQPGPPGKVSCPSPEPGVSGEQKDGDSPGGMVGSMLLSFVDAGPDSD